MGGLITLKVDGLIFLIKVLNIDRICVAILLCFLISQTNATDAVPIMIMDS